MYRFIKKLLFLLSPEKAHRVTMQGLRILTAIPFGKAILKHQFSFYPPQAATELMGLQFKNPVGLAAGFDKNARYIDVLDKLGFGFIEIGTVTPLPQPGNPPPRLFRLPKDRALINRMGFNNDGVIAVAERLRKRKSDIIIGGNIGKNKITPNENAVADYKKCFLALFDEVDYFVINVSSPNTPNLRQLQDKEPLKNLLVHLQQLNEQQKKSKPILLKIAPDLSYGQLDDIINIVLDTRLAGIIATNTTIGREGLISDRNVIEKIGVGGLSGKPLQARSTEVIKYIHEKSAGKILIIASGGIFTAEDVQEKLTAGASLVQVYTGFIYEGPAMVKNICRKLFS